MHRLPHITTTTTTTTHPSVHAQLPPPPPRGLVHQVARLILTPLIIPHHTQQGASKISPPPARSVPPLPLSPQALVPIHK